MPAQSVRLQVAVRVLADALMVNGSLLLALIFDYVAHSEMGPGVQETVIAHLLRYGRSFWILTSISLAVFAAIGFYSRGRAYSSRYKALVVAQAVLLTCLLLGLANYLRLSTLPRTAFLATAVIMLLVLEAARGWAWLWEKVMSRGPVAAALPVQNECGVLVIGGAGYIGSALLPMLLDRGYRVRLLDAFVYGEDTIDEVKNHPNLEILRADFRQVDSIVKAMQGVSTVIHLGAIVGDPACALDEQLTIETNLVATRFIAEVAKGGGISRFIFASTCSVYGSSDEILNEHSALNPVSLYARSKIASERVLMELRDDKFHPVILRFGTIYGLSGRTRFDLVVNLLTAKALREGRITVFGANQWRPFVHVADAAAAVLATVEAPPRLLSHHCIFNVGSDEQNTTLGEVGALIKRLVPTADLIISEPDGDRRNYRVDFSCIRNLLGFTPTWTLELGIRQVIAAVASPRVADYSDPKYSNVKFLSEQGADILRAHGDWVQSLLSAERVREPVLPLPKTAAGTFANTRRAPAGLREEVRLA